MKTTDCNLLDAPADIIAQCCNCFNTMGAGVAAAIAQEYPEAVEADNETKKGDKSKLGSLSLCVVKDPTTHKNQAIKAIANLYGQFGFARDNRAVNYEAMYSALVEFRDKLKPAVKTVAFPYKMGCGLAGGDWRIVEKMIEVVFDGTTFDVLICKYEPKP